MSNNTEEKKRKNTSVSIFLDPVTWSIFIVIIAVAGAWAIYFLSGLEKQADDLGEVIGTTTGETVGRAIGSFNGITRGIDEGKTAGKEEGLSAADTEVEYAEVSQLKGKLQVLKVSMSVTNFHSINDEYAKLDVVPCDVIFTVDLDKKEIDDSVPGKIIIYVPEPEMTPPEIDETKREKIAEYMKHFYTGSAEDGYMAGLNSRRNIEAKLKDNKGYYPTALDMAKASAKQDIESLVSNVRSKDGKEIEVKFFSDKE